MHVPPLGGRVAVALEEALAGLLDGRRFGSKRWLVKRRRRQLQRQHRAGRRRPCGGRRTRRAAGLLTRHRERILEELDVSSVLPRLVHNKVFSPAEYTEILAQASGRRRAEVFLERLSSKGPGAFRCFCSVLEEVRPQLLTCFLLDGEDGDLRRGKKGGLRDPIKMSRDPHSGGKPLSTPPMHRDPLLDSRKQVSSCGRTSSSNRAEAAEGAGPLGREALQEHLGSPPAGRPGPGSPCTRPARTTLLCTRRGSTLAHVQLLQDALPVPRQEPGRPACPPPAAGPPAARPVAAAAAAFLRLFTSHRLEPNLLPSSRPASASSSATATRPPPTEGRACLQARGSGARPVFSPRRPSGCCVADLGQEQTDLDRGPVLTGWLLTDTKKISQAASPNVQACIWV
ncbi:unnamed protein product [Boreogadus saida]